MKIQIRWQDTETGKHYNQTCTTPVTIGRELDNTIVLSHNDVSRKHAIITEQNGKLLLEDQQSSNGTTLDDKPCHAPVLILPEQIISIAIFALHIVQPAAETRRRVNPAGPKQDDLETRRGRQAHPHTPESKAKKQRPTKETKAEEYETRPPVDKKERSKRDEFANYSTLFFNKSSDQLDQNAPPPESPLPSWLQKQHVSMHELRKSGLEVEETDYLAVGGGIGSFVWVDHLLIHGAPRDKIRVLGLESKPYARYKQLCKNSQIPVHERLRSNSDSCPDNIWGWPGYGLREAWHELSQFHPIEAIGIFWQVFSEPALAQTYTPKAGDVYLSIERERKRIGWKELFREGRAKAIRKTDDGRYAVYYSAGKQDDDTTEHKIFVARYIQLALGYPGVRFLPDLQKHRQETGDKHHAVNAYEQHDHVYQHLEEHGGTVLLRGRGIVASRILQRIYEARQENDNIHVFHLMRSPNTEGNKAGKAQRDVFKHWEFQPFNWPKSCWGGDLRVEFENATPKEREKLLKLWGGTTTADRKDWIRILREGSDQGWYNIQFGDVSSVALKNKKLITHLKGKTFGEETKLTADFVIDCTGLEASLCEYPILWDMVEMYGLDLNPEGRLSVTNSFEVNKMQQEKGGMMFACGAMTLGGPYAAVDSFLGLQYSAIVSMDALRKQNAPGLQALGPFRSFGQWLRWCFNQTP